jgi:serine phosphatase RsbU (regulator of sigma subunit)
MRAIGGDYLYAKFINGQILGALRTGELPDGTGTQPPDNEPCELVVVILDVCGHGISAALTVNRLHGELERQLAEQPNITPAELLCALNRYVYLTLAHHSIFVTAVAFRVSESTDRLHYASAGHPPAIVLRPDAPAELLAPTAMVLGVDRDLMIEAQNASVPFHPGDTLIAYTDGATEARNAQGEMLNTKGLSDLAQASVGARKPQTAPPHSPGVCTRLMSAINQHRFGPPTDDTLIVHVCRASTHASTPPHAPAPRSIPATQTAGA